MGKINSYTTQNWHNVGAFTNSKQTYSANATIFSSSKVGASGGTTAGWWGDENCWWYQSGYPEGTAKFGGKNGKPHWQLISFGGGPQPFIQTQVTALKFYQANDSTAGHGMYVNRFGLVLISDNGSTEVWDLSGEMGRPGGYGKWHEKTFNSSLNDRLKSWKIYRLLVQLSTSGGKGDRTTNTTVEKLQFKTAGNSGWRIIMPWPRAYSERSKWNMIG